MRFNSKNTNVYWGPLQLKGFPKDEDDVRVVFANEGAQSFAGEHDGCIVEDSRTNGTVTIKFQTTGLGRTILAELQLYKNFGGPPLPLTIFNKDTGVAYVAPLAQIMKNADDQLGQGRPVIELTWTFPQMSSQRAPDPQGLLDQAAGLAALIS